MVKIKDMPVVLFDRHIFIEDLTLSPWLFALEWNPVLDYCSPDMATDITSSIKCQKHKFKRNSTDYDILNHGTIIRNNYAD